MRKQDHWKDASVAGRYDAIRFSGRRGAWKQARDEALVGRLLAGVRGRILDLPCGTGRLGASILRGGEGRSVVGADLSRPMLAAGRVQAEHYRLRVLGSAFRLPFRDAAFGGAVVLRFLFHLDGAWERCAVLRELGRVTEGPVVVQVRYGATMKHVGRALRHRAGLASRPLASRTRGEIEQEFREAGLEVRSLSPVSRLFSDKALVVGQGSGQDPAGSISRIP